MDTKSREGESRDIYGEAIPAEELAELARTHRKECSARDEASVRHCAEAIVRSNTCCCVATQTSIVNALVEDFMSTIDASADPRAGCGSP